MAEEAKDVKEAAPVTDVPPKEENSGEASGDAAKVDRTVYEKVREDMLTYKAEKKTAQSELARMQAEIDALKSAKEPEDEPEEVDVRTKAKLEVLYLIQTDPFVKENLSLVEEKMADNPKLTAKEAVRELQAEFFQRMQKEVSQSSPEVPPKQVKPGSSTTDRSNIIKDALEGKHEGADPAQLEAYKRQLARLPK